MSSEGRATSNEQVREDSTGLAQGLAKRLSVDTASGQAKKQKQKSETIRRSARRGGTAAAAGTETGNADAVDDMETEGAEEREDGVEEREDESTNGGDVQERDLEALGA